MPDALMTEHGAVLTVTLDRDAKLNAINHEMTAVLWQAVETAAVRDDIRALLITARGRYFTAGIDLNAPTPAGVARTGQEFRRLYRDHHRLYDEFEALEKPIVLAAQGPCLGAGLEMAGSCDFRLAAHGTYFQLPEVALGTIAGSGGISRITRLLGPHWAKWLAMANQRVYADQALAIGLVHRVLPADGFAQAVLAFCDQIAALPMQAIGATKRAIDMCADVDRATARDIERTMNGTLVTGAEFGAISEQLRSQRGLGTGLTQRESPPTL
jgi:enoyl-CoA hydratase